MLPVSPTIWASEHCHLCDDKHIAWRGGAEFDAMKVDCVIIGVQSVSDGIPAVAAVPAGKQPANLDGGVYVRRVRGVGGDADYSFCQRRHVGRYVRIGDSTGVHLLPRRASV